jgi:hypothetical protein
MKELHSQIDINASAERVWQLLTDFASYPQWNPFIRRISGEPTTGERLQVRLELPESRSITLRPKELTAEPNHQVRWLASVCAGHIRRRALLRFPIVGGGLGSVLPDRSLQGFARSPVCPQPG